MQLRVLLVPLLWFLVANVSLQRLINRGFKVVTYVVDVIILVGGKFLSML